MTTRAEVAYAQEEFNVDVAIDSASINPKTKEVTIYFTVTCSQPAEFADSFVTVRQSPGIPGLFGPANDKSVVGSAYIQYECSRETPLSVTVTVKAHAGFFTSGSALVFADAFACTAEVCDYATTQEQVKLS